MSCRKRLAAVGAAAAAVLLMSPSVTSRAYAQSCGRVVFTQTPAPEGASKAEIARFLKKHSVSSLTRKNPKSGWNVYLFIHLRFVPHPRVLYLPQNRGQLHMVFYRQTKRRWVRDNVVDIAYTRGARILRLPFKISTDLGLVAGARYQVRITLLNRRNSEIVLASTHVTLK